MNTDPRDVAKALRKEAAVLDQEPTPDQVARRLRIMAAELEEAADRLERYVESRP